MFLHCLNHWRLETPAVRKAAPKNEENAAERTTPDDADNYKVSIVFSCHVLSCSFPTYAGSFPFLGV